MSFTCINKEFENKMKPFKTFDEQINILISRNLIIEDRNKAKETLRNVNYYRFVAYLLPYKDKNEFFSEQLTIEDVYNLYEIDGELRNILLRLIEKIEISFRTYISYTLGDNYGALGYLDPNNFYDDKYHSEFIKELSMAKRSKSSQNKLFVRHHNDKYQGLLPVWVMVELLNISHISKLFSNMNEIDNIKLCNSFCNRQQSYIVKNWLHCITNLRNECAHYGRLYGTKLQDSIILKKYKKYNIDNNCLFAYLLFIKDLTYEPDVWVDYVGYIENLFNASDILDIKLYGFPSNWKQLFITTQI